MKTARNPDIAKWECARCGTWNTMDHAMCVSCNSPAATYARAFRLADTLSSQEKTFYEVLMPELLREIKSIRREVEHLRNELQEYEEE